MPTNVTTEVRVDHRPFGFPVVRKCDLIMDTYIGKKEKQ